MGNSVKAAWFVVRSDRHYIARNIAPFMDAVCKLDFGDSLAWLGNPPNEPFRPVGEGLRTTIPVDFRRPRQESNLWPSV
jgi:hypothetical protein